MLEDSSTISNRSPCSSCWLFWSVITNLSIKLEKKNCQIKSTQKHNVKKFHENDTYLAILVPTGAVSLTSKSPFPPLSINFTNCPSIMLKPLTTISSFLIISWGLFLGMFWLVVFSSALVLDVLLATLTTLFAVP